MNNINALTVTPIFIIDVTSYLLECNFNCVEFDTPPRPKRITNEKIQQILGIKNRSGAVSSDAGSLVILTFLLSSCL